MATDFEFTAEQDELRRTVRALVRSGEPSYEPGSARGARLWTALAGETGLVGLLDPGSGAGVRDLTVVLEELGADLTPTPYFSTAVLAVGLLRALGEVDLLPALCSGERTAAVGFVGPDGDWTAPGSGVTATPDGSLTGTSSYVLDGHTADLLLVCARTPDGVGVFAVEADARGLTRTPLRAFDDTRPLASLGLDATPGRLVGGADSSAAIRAALELAVVGLAAEQVGGAGHALDMAVGYAKERVQFGRAIGSFQAIKHWCADLLVDHESARSALYAAASALDEGPAERAAALAALAGACCSDTYRTVAAATIQIHGGMGFTWEHPAHRYLRRALGDHALLGDPALHRDRLVGLLEAGRIELAPARADVPTRAEEPARADPRKPAEEPAEAAQRKPAHPVSLMAAAAIAEHGSPDLNERLRPALESGELDSCLLYSEPGAGSDLAGLRTRADLVDGRYIVNGQKIWTSGAVGVDYGLLLARTDFDVPKHQGISFMLIPMRQPGVEVRPLRQITGESHFNEVFLTDAEVPAENVVGAPGAGWRVLRTALAVERALMGERNTGASTRAGAGAGRPDDVLDLARRHGRLGDPVIRQCVATVLSLAAAQRWNDARGRHGDPRVAGIGKLAMSRLLHTTARVRREILGTAALLDGPEHPDQDQTNFLTLNAYFTSIGGGTDQIQKTIIGERILGLPREPEIDKHIPFRQVRGSA